jgi:hypothetical protein
LTELPAFTVEPGDWAVARLGPRDAVPPWAASADFSSVTRTADELSIVCPAGAVPESVRCERGWAMLKLAGPFPFEAVGVLSSVLAPLAAARISVFAVSTFDTDYVLMKRGDLGSALGVLEKARGPHRDRKEMRA